MAGKELGDTKKKRKGTDPTPGDGLTLGGRDRAERKAERVDRTALRAERMGLEAPIDEGVPFDGGSAWSAALHDGMAQGVGMRDIMAEHNPGLFGPYVKQPAAAPATDPMGLGGAGPLAALPPELAGMAAASPAGMPAFGAPPAAAPTATVNNFPQQPPMGGGQPMGMVPPSGGLMGMQQRRPGLPAGFAANPMAGGTMPGRRRA